MSEGDIGQVSADGQWYWDGQKWLSTTSPDGKFRWTGTAWVAAGARPAPSTAAVVTTRTNPWLVGGIGRAVALIAVVSMIAAAGAGVGSNRQSNSAQLQSHQQSPVASVGGPNVSTVQSSPTPSNVASPSPSPAHVASPSPKPSLKPSAKPSPKPVVQPKPSTCGAPANPWGYNFCGGSLINSPATAFCSYFNCIPSFWKSTNGYVVQCVDGTYSHSGGRSGACSYHGGVRRALYKP